MKHLYLLTTQENIFILVILQVMMIMGEVCEKEKECGWNSYCKDGQCECIPGYEWTYNNRDCYDKQCSNSKCLDCTSRTTCRRCVDFIEDGTGKCLGNCDTTYVFSVEGNHVGRVCKVGSDGDAMMTLYMAIIIGVSVGVVLTTFIALAFYWKMRSDRDDVEEVQKLAGELHQKHRNNTKTGSTRIRVSPLGTNRVTPISNGHLPGQTFSTSNTDQVREDSCDTRSNGVGRAETSTSAESTFLLKVALLRPHSDTFVDMLSEAKRKIRSLPQDDDKVYVFKNIIHQICRVLTLLNCEDEQLVKPPDGESLLTWAEKIMKKYLQAQTRSTNVDLDSMENSNTDATSTFRPDCRILANGHAQGGSTAAPASNSFTYEN